MAQYHASPRAAVLMLYKHAFVVVLDGSSGYHYIECKECGGDNQNDRTKNYLNRHKVRHKISCTLAAVLKGSIYAK